MYVQHYILRIVRQWLSNFGTDAYIVHYVHFTIEQLCGCVQCALLSDYTPRYVTYSAYIWILLVYMLASEIKYIFSFFKYRNVCIVNCEYIYIGSTYIYIIYSPVLLTLYFYYILHITRILHLLCILYSIFFILFYIGQK